MPEELRRKIGDQLVVIDNTAGHGFQIGTTVTITNLYPEGDDPHYKAEDTEGKTWFLVDEELSEPLDKGSDVMQFTMKDLENCFRQAIAEESRYIGIMVSMKGLPKEEIIINPRENFMNKMSYYQSAYDENLNHKFSQGIKITSFGFGNSLEGVRTVMNTLRVLRGFQHEVTEHFKD